MVLIRKVLGWTTWQMVGEDEGRFEDADEDEEDDVEGEAGQEQPRR